MSREFTARPETIMFINMLCLILVRLSLKVGQTITLLTYLMMGITLLWGEMTKYFMFTTKRTSTTQWFMSSLSPESSMMPSSAMTPKTLQ